MADQKTKTGEETKFDDSATIESMTRLKPLAQEMLDYIASAKLPMGNNSEEEDDKYFPHAEALLKMMLRDDIKFTEADTLFQLLLQVVDKLKVIIVSSVGKSYSKAREIKFGKSFDDIRMSDIDTILKESAPKQEVKTEGIPTA